MQPKNIRLIGHNLSKLMYHPEDDHLADPIPTTVLAVTHKLELLEEWDAIMMMYDGQVAAFDTMRNLYKEATVFTRFMQQNEGLMVQMNGMAVITPERLQLVWLFAHVDKKDLQDVAASFCSRTLMIGEKLFEYGQEVDSLIVLARGSAEEVPGGEDGEILID